MQMPQYEVPLQLHAVYKLQLMDLVNETIARIKRFCTSRAKFKYNNWLLHNTHAFSLWHKQQLHRSMCNTYHEFAPQFNAK
mmetsp:Transcript_49900/g.50262  ORF Transcript_49900/g.50262 Transcript_49900/m.50262 type:complete len:81 (+) Transcript_49900:140-382(+)